MLNNFSFVSFFPLLIYFFLSCKISSFLSNLLIIIYIQILYNFAIEQMWTNTKLYLYNV